MNLWTKEIIIRNSKIVEDNRNGVNNATLQSFPNGEEQVCIFTQPHTDGVNIIILKEGHGEEASIDLYLDKDQLKHLQRLLDPYMG